MAKNKKEPAIVVSCTVSAERTLVFDERHSRTGPQLRVCPLLSSVGIPRLRGQHVSNSHYNLDANASFACWISEGFFV